MTLFIKDIASDTTLSDHSEDLEGLKFKALIKVAYFALAVHLLLIPLFYYLGVLFLSLLNIASASAWIGGIRLIQQGHHTAGIRLFCAEVVVHSLAVCATLGMEPGFQFYLWAVAGMMLIDYRMQLRLAIAWSLLLVITFATLYLFFGDVAYQYPFREWLPYVHFANIVIAGGPMVYVIALIRVMTLSQRNALTELAAKDFLTQLYNRRFARELMLGLYSECQRNQRPICLIMADIDYFKQINDNYGHDAGDRVLKRISTLLKEEVRASDIVARWGGEEFLIAMPDISLQNAYHKVESVRQKVMLLDTGDIADDITLSMSFGLLQWPDNTDLDEAINLTDKALYKSKYHGRNQITLAEPGNLVFGR